MTLLKMKLSVCWHQIWMDPAPLAEPTALKRADHHQVVSLPREMQPGPLTSPWPPLKGQGFWERYLRQWRTLDEVRPDLAWRALVPLRSADAPLRLTVEGDDARVSSEGFVHPWGGTFAVHLTLAGEWGELAAAADRLRDLRREKRFALDGDEANPLRLDELAVRGLQALRPQAAEATPGPISEGFSVFALLAAIGIPAEFDPAVEATGAARFLHAVTSFSPTWAEETPRPLAEARVAGKRTAPSSHLVYGSSRARAIWSPARFSISPQKKKEEEEGKGERRITVGCHHRNLTLASMQTEALARFASETADRLAAGSRLGGEHDFLARCAVGRLGLLYLGDLNTYRSGSPKAQIDQAQLLGQINAVRVAGQMPAIV